MNEQMTLTPPFHLSIENVKPNKEERILMKLAANSLFGKLQQKNVNSKTIFVRSQVELEEKYLKFKDDIVNIKCHESICEIIIKGNDQKAPINKESNCYIGGQVTAYVRQFIHEKILKIDSIVGSKIFYVDTDAIMFTLPNKTSNPLPISEIVGEFKNVIEYPITHFYCLGVKNYLLVSKQHNDQKEIYCKIKGISLKSFLLNTEINDQIYSDYIEEFIANQHKSKVLHQLKQRNHMSKLEKFTFSNEINLKRNILYNHVNYLSIPFGYDNK